MPASPPRVAVIGECLVELREAGTECFAYKFGGDTFNTAAYMAKLGNRFGPFVDYISAVGDDHLSRQMLSFWESKGVGTSLAQTIAGLTVGLYFISVDHDGERHFTYWRNASAAREVFETNASDHILEELSKYSLIYISGISLAVLKPLSRERLLTRLANLAQTGVSIAFDCNHRPILWQSEAEAKAVWERVFSFAKWIFLTREELLVLKSSNDRKIDFSIFDSWPAIEVVIKDGAAPCVIRSDNGIIQVPAEKVAQIVDTTAAGDSFSAGYLLARILGKTIQNSAKIAHALAAVVISHPGAVIPDSFIPDLLPMNNPAI